MIFEPNIESSVLKRFVISVAPFIFFVEILRMKI